MQDTRPDMRALPGSDQGQDVPEMVLLPWRRSSGLMLMVSVLAGLIGVIFLYLAVISSLYALPMLLCSVLCFAYVGSFYLREYLLRRQTRQTAADARRTVSETLSEPEAGKDEPIAGN